jgi:uncharacterized peroxidase-related enzyme
VVRQLERDPASADVTPRRRALIAYAVALSTAPASMSEGHVVSLREAGFSDEAIHAAASITAYFNFVNRVALGLGVELE